MTKRGGNAVNAAAEWVDIRSLVPWERNPVVHTNAEIEELRALVASSVWTDPLVARRSDLRIIAGHRRRLAALSALAMDPAWTLPDAPGVGFVPVRFVEVDDATAARLTIADNAMTKQSQWDDGELVAMLREIEDPSGLGFGDEELAAMLGAAADDCAEPPNPFGNLPTGSPEFRQMTFTLTYGQQATIEAALTLAIEAGEFADTGNTNRNGNALARIAEAFRG